MMFDGTMGGGMAIWMILGTLFWILLIMGIVMFVVWALQKGVVGGSRTEESALEILKKRYVRGEISKDEFEKMKRDIL